MMKKLIGIFLALLMLCSCAAADGAVSGTHTVTLTVTPNTGLLLYQDVTYKVRADGATHVRLIRDIDDGYPINLDWQDANGYWSWKYSDCFDKITVYAEASFDGGATWIATEPQTLCFEVLGSASFKAVADSGTVVKGKQITIRFSDLQHVEMISSPCVYFNGEMVEPAVEMDDENAYMTCDTADLEPGTYKFEFWSGPDGYGYAEYCAVVNVTVQGLKLPTGAYSDETGHYNITSKGTATFKSPAGSAANVKIPASIKVDGFTVPVTAVGVSAFAKSTKLTSVSIGSNVKTIGTGAFSGCKNLKSVSGGANVETINDNAFNGCVKLASLAAFKKLKTIGRSAFNNCIVLKSFSIPGSVTSVGEKAFYGCKKLASVSGMKSLKKIEAETFSGCAALKTVNIPARVSIIGKKAFYGCTALTKVSGMSGVTSIGAGAFQNCKTMTAFTIGSKTTKIGASAFSGCARLKTLTINAKLKAANIGANAFAISKNATVKCPSGKKNEFSKWIYKKGLPKTAKLK